MRIGATIAAVLSLLLLTGAAPMVPYSDTGVPSTGLVPGNGEAMVPNALGGTPPPPPVGCLNSLDFSDGCNSQYFAMGMRF